MKKKLSILLSFVMILSLCCPMFASASTNFAISANNIIENITAREDETLQVINSESWLPLEDVSGTEYAYFIPIVSGNQIAGYSVVSYVGGVNHALKTATGEVSADFAEFILEVASSSTVDRIIYEFPDAFLAESNGSYYKICISEVLEPVDPNDFQHVTAASLTNISTTNPTISAAQSQTLQPKEYIEYASLDDFLVGEFVPIPNGSTYYYGGYQGWLVDEGVSESEANRSCGVTAAANMMHYMATHLPGKSALYNQTGLTKAKFNAFQRDVYDYLDPTIFGIPTAAHMQSGILSYAQSRNVTLTPITFSTTTAWTFDNVLNYVMLGLNAESPVLLLTFNSPIAELELHWVTLTQIYADNVATYMVTSNWGERAVYDFYTWVTTTTPETFSHGAALFFV